MLNSVLRCASIFFVLVGSLVGQAPVTLELKIDLSTLGTIQDPPAGSNSLGFVTNDLIALNVAIRRAESGLVGYFHILDASNGQILKSAELPFSSSVQPFFHVVQDRVLTRTFDKVYVFDHDLRLLGSLHSRSGPSDSLLLSPDGSAVAVPHNSKHEVYRLVDLKLIGVLPSAVNGQEERLAPLPTRDGYIEVRIIHTPPPAKPEILMNNVKWDKTTTAVFRERRNCRPSFKFIGVDLFFDYCDFRVRSLTGEKRFKFALGGLSSTGFAIHAPRFSFCKPPL